MDDTHLELRESSVMLVEAAYFTAEACRAAADLRRQQASWYPLPAGDEIASAPAALGEPRLGGC